MPPTDDPSVILTTAAAPPSDPPPNTYDQLPYNSYPYPQASPDRLHVIASLMGLHPAPPDHCRVLELGCASGGHLIPLAARFPNCQFLGIDSSHRQIAAGQRIIAALALRNIHLEHQDILSITPDLGQFDYILSHGVFSWVPPNIQNHLLAIASKNLAPRGIAYISYNVFPGWRNRGILRDMLLYQTAGLPTPADRLHHARQFIDLLAQSIPEEKTPHHNFLRRELTALRGKDDDYLFHEHLEAHNAPLYFHQFIEHSARHRLQFVGEASYHLMSAVALKPATVKRLRTLARNRIDIEQYYDFLSNRMFRQTLLCHQNLSISDEPLPDRLQNFFIASSLKPEDPALNLHSPEPATFRSPKAVAKTAQPLMKSALLHLSEIWPTSIPFTDLLSRAHSRLQDSTTANLPSASDTKNLAEALLRCYATDQIELTAHPAHFTRTISDRPVAFPLARLQAQFSNLATTLRHEIFTLSDLQRCLLPLLDGTRDRPALLHHLTTLVSTGTLTLRRDGIPIQTDPAIRDALESPLTTALTQLARAALLLV